MPWTPVARAQKTNPMEHVGDALQGIATGINDTYKTVQQEKLIKAEQESKAQALQAGKASVAQIYEQMSSAIMREDALKERGWDAGRGNRLLAILKPTESELADPKTYRDRVMPIYQNAAFYEYLGGDLTIEPEEFAMPNEAFTKLMNERKTITDNERNSRGINEAIFGGMVPSGPAVDTGKGFTEQDMQQISPASSPQDAVKRMRERGIDPKLAGLDLGLMPKPKEPVEVSEKDKIDLQIQQERLEQERLKTAEARRKAFGGPENKPRDPDEYNRVYSAANNEKKAAKEDSLSKEEYNPLFSIDKQALNIMAEDPKITSDQARIKAEKRVEENYKAVQLIRESLDYESMSADVYRGSESDQLVNSSGQVNIYHPKFVELVQKSAGKFSPYQILFKVQQHYGAGNAVQ